MSYIFLLENLPQLNYLSFRSTIPMVKLIKLMVWDFRAVLPFWKQFWKQLMERLKLQLPLNFLHYLLRMALHGYCSIWTMQTILNSIVFASWLTFRIPHMLNFILLLYFIFCFANLTSFSVACIILNIVYIRLSTILFV